MLPDHVHRDHRHRARQHHGGQHQAEQEIAARKAEVGEAEGDQRAAEGDGGCGGQGHGHAVQRPLQHRRVMPDVGVVRESPVPGDETVVEDLGARLERRAHQPQERIQEQHAGRAEDDVWIPRSTTPLQPSAVALDGWCAVPDAHDRAVGDPIGIDTGAHSRGVDVGRRRGDDFVVPGRGHLVTDRLRRRRTDGDSRTWIAVMIMMITNSNQASAEAYPSLKKPNACWNR